MAKTPNRYPDLTIDGDITVEPLGTVDGRDVSEDGAKLDQLSLPSAISAKQTVRAATAAAGTLVSSFENGDTIDGVVLATGDRILIKDQASGDENGIYVVEASGAPTRADDLPAAANARGISVIVQEGTANADSLWLCTTDGPSDVVGTDALTFAEFSGGGGGPSLSNIAPVDVTKAAASAGVGTEASRNNHKHNVATAVVGNAQVGDTAAEGSSTSLARADHTHGVAAGSPVTVGTGNAAGSAGTFARSDHVHDHGSQTDGTHHAAATVSVAGFLSASDKTKLDALITPAFRDPKESVRAATTVNGTLATDFENGDSVDGVTLATNDRILIKNQSTTSQNGIYVVQATGAPSRAVDMPAASNAAGVSVFVEEGTVNADTGWLCTTDAPNDVVGTDSLAFGKFSGTDLSTTAPVNVTKAAASAGSSGEAARQDHKHNVDTAAAGGIQVGDSAAEGSSTSLARADHTHALSAPGAPADVTKAAASAGSAATVARSDHKHDVSTASTAAAAVEAGGSAGEGTATSLARSDHTHAVAVGSPATVGTANAAGSASTFVRSDHVHAHGNQTSGSLHAAAVSGGTSGFMTGADKEKVDGLALPEDTTHKNRVRVASDAAGTLSTDFENGDTVDGVVLATGDRILVKDQASGDENGIYTVEASGAPTRADDLPAGSEGAGISVFVAEGTANADTLWLCTTNPGSDAVGTDALTFTEFSGGGGGGPPLSSTAPVNVTKAAASAGVSTEASRQDHKHDVDTAAAGTIGVGDSAAEGSATSLARSDHTHALTAPAAPADVTKAAASAGAATTVARSDHKHDVSTAAAGTAQVGDSAAEGSATSLARSDHTHALTAPGAPADVDKSAASAGASANVARQDHKHDVATAAPGGTAVQIGNSAAEGSSANLARADHTHTVADGTPVDVGTANATGAATSFARSDHVHDHGQQTDATLHAAATVSLAGFMSASDKTKLDAMITPAFRDPKESVRVATTAAGTLASDFENGDSVDGVTLATNDRILIKNQATASENGIYIVQATGAPSRATDMPAASSAAGVSVFIEEGTTNADTGWLCTTDAPSDVVGTDNLTFGQFSGTPLSTTPPVNVTKAAASAGSATEAARQDHKHDVSTAAPGGTAVQVGNTASEGSATSLARSDHTHTVAAGTPVNVTKAANAAGAAATFARSDHKHDVTTAAANTITVGAAAAEGAATSLARSDHTHALTAPPAPANVTKAAASAGAASTVARSDHKHDVTTAAPSGTAVAIGNSASEGSATSLSRSDHTHTVASGTPVTIGTANSAGAATTFARSNHVHAHGNQTSGTLHAAATTSVAGFMSAADKTKFDALPALAAAPWKQTVRVATTANGTLATAYENGDTIDGVVLATGNRILLKDQTTASENGVYTVNATGAPTRATDLPAASNAAGVVVVVQEGTANADTAWLCTSNTGSAVVGTNNLVFTEFGAGGGASTFLGLTDAPSSYSGQALKAVRVNAGETALEFATASGGTVELPFELFTRTQTADGGAAPAAGQWDVFSGSSGTPSGVTTIRIYDYTTGFAQDQSPLLNLIGAGNLLKIVPAGGSSEWAYYQITAVSVAGLVKFVDVDFVLASSSFALDESSDYNFSVYYGGSTVSSTISTSWEVSLPASNTQWMSHSSLGYFDTAVNTNLGTGPTIDYTLRGAVMGGTGAIAGYHFAGYEPTSASGMIATPAWLQKTAGTVVTTSLTPQDVHGASLQLSAAANSWAELTNFSLTGTTSFTAGDELIVLFKNQNSVARTYRVDATIYLVTLSLG